MTDRSVPTTQQPPPDRQDSLLIPPSLSLLTIKTAEFTTSAIEPRHYPPGGGLEVAFAGRSNVGKSSLINCLTQRKKLVRTSRTPGLTRMINFFRINGEFFFVDLPGYGFARVPERVRAQWKPMVESYLLGRKSLRGVVQIMDIRHLPTVDDLQLWSWLKDRHISALPVLTKADKLNQNKRSVHVKAAAQALDIRPEGIVLFSSTTGLGREELMRRLQGLLEVSMNDPSATSRGEPG